MALRLVRCSRVPQVPLWAAVVVGVWSALVLAAYLVSQRTGVPIATCTFRRVTGVPCATCGGTRVVLHAAEGDLGWSFASNPLLFVLLASLLATTTLRVVAGRRVSLGLPPLSSRGRRLALIGFLVLLAANWAYLILAGI
jgi:hypothetical protein